MHLCILCLDVCCTGHLPANSHPPAHLSFLKAVPQFLLVQPVPCRAWQPRAGAVPG